MKIYKSISMILLFIIINQSVIAQKALELSNEELFNLSLEELMELDVVTTSKFSLENTAEAPSVISVITKDQIKKKWRERHGRSTSYCRRP